jgi:microcystin-dependent protein
MSETYLGQVILVGYNFATRGFALCQGQLQSIAQNSALFSLLGTTYGGDGRTTFGLPNLSGRVVIGQGSSPGLSPRQIGQFGGTESTTLTVANMPSHSHSAALVAEGAAASSADPTGRMLAQAQTYADAGRAQNVTMSSESIAVGNNGGGQAFDTMQPFLVMNYQISLYGIFPSRD